MQIDNLSNSRVKSLLQAARNRRILVVGDVMLDQFVWGKVSRISPEAPVPVVDYVRESCMPGGAANVARNLSALQVRTEMFSVVGRDEGARKLRQLLAGENVHCQGILTNHHRTTSIKTRIVAHQQQIVRLDRETRLENDPLSTRRLLASLESALPSADAVVVGDYGKGIVTQSLVDRLKRLCRERAVWLSLDPKPIHPLDLTNLSLLTPNRKEAFALAGLRDDPQAEQSAHDPGLIQAAHKLLEELRPAVLLITLGDHGMLLCQRGKVPIPIPTVAQEVFDVSGAGDTVIALFTLAIVSGASPLEAAIVSNHAAGIVVGKMGTATVDRGELLASFSR